MPLLSPELKTINDAFLTLPDEIREHSERVAEYTEAAFRKIVTMDLYISDPRSSLELDLEKLRPYVTGALYHDIGKLLPDRDEADENGKVVHKDHCLLGVDIAGELPPAEGRFQPTERRIYLSAIREHHEYICGGGEPTGKGMEDLAFAGRIVAIANRIDNLAMSLRVEDPITRALDLMKEEVKAARFDPEFYRAFRAVKSKLKKTFERYRHTASAVPETDTWIPRKAHRPMELRYIDRKVQIGDLTVDVREAMMRFRNRTEQMLKYSDLKHHIANAKLGPSLGRYFTYELLDAIRRFRTVGADCPLYAIELPPVWYGSAEFAEETLTALKNEGIEPEALILILPDDLTKPQRTAFGKQEATLKDAGLGIFRRSDWEASLQTEAPLLVGELSPEATEGSEGSDGLSESSIVDSALARAGVPPEEGGDAD